MASRLLGELETAISAATDATQADCLRAECAGLLARQGARPEAVAILGALQARNAGQSQPRVCAWQCFAEGLLTYFTDTSLRAHDKLLRAYALASEARDSRLQSLAVAWLAYMDYVALDLESMARRVAEALQLAHSQNHGARGRACLVVAMAYHFGGRFPAAQPWYAKARAHANAQGDEAMLGAVMYNMAALQADEARQLALHGESPDTHLVRRAMLGLESARNYAALMRVTCLNAWVPLLCARMHALEGRYAEAATLYESHFSDGLLQGFDRARACLGADLAWCRVQLGQHELARREAMAAAVSVAHDHDVDDRAAAHTRLAHVFGALGEIHSASHHAQQAQQLWHAHQEDRLRAVRLMDAILPTLRT